VAVARGSDLDHNYQTAMDGRFISDEEMTSPLFLHVMLNIEVYRAKQHGNAFALVTVGINDFESLPSNIQTELLVDVGNEIERLCEPLDLVFCTDQYFNVLRPGKSRSESQKFAEQISNSLNQSVWLASGLEGLKFTASIVSFPEDGNSKADLVRRWIAANRK
jgi:hypothetical protein